MFNKSRTTRFMFFGILLVIIAAAIATFVYFSPVPAAQASSPYLEPAAPDAVRNNCIISNILVSTDRIHVRCTTAYLGIEYYAISSNAVNARNANRFLVVLNTAYALGKPVDVWYNSLSSANPPNCLASNCRLLEAVIIY
jgi:hypothetical protein